MSCFFVTLVCWDMAGDKGGWSQALWVPGVGVVMPVVICLCDHFSVAGNFGLCLSSLPSFRSSLLNLPSKPDIATSLEFVRSSLHQIPSHKSPSGQEESAIKA
jgi:hypothetical protein